MKLKLSLLLIAITSFGSLIMAAGPGTPMDLVHVNTANSALFEIETTDPIDVEFDDVLITNGKIWFDWNYFNDGGTTNRDQYISFNWYNGVSHEESYLGLQASGTKFVFPGYDEVNDPIFIGLSSGSNTFDKFYVGMPTSITPVLTFFKSYFATPDETINGHKGTMYVENIANSPLSTYKNYGICLNVDNDTGAGFEAQGIHMEVGSAYRTYGMHISGTVDAGAAVVGAYIDCDGLGQRFALATDGGYIVIGKLTAFDPQTYIATNTDHLSGNNGVHIHEANLEVDYGGVYLEDAEILTLPIGVPSSITSDWRPGLYWNNTDGWLEFIDTSGFRYKVDLTPI